MRLTLSKSLFLLTATVGLIIGLNDATQAYVPSPATLSVINDAELARRPGPPKGPTNVVGRRYRNDVRDRMDDRHDDDFRDRIRDR